MNKNNAFLDHMEESISMSKSTDGVKETLLATMDAISKIPEILDENFEKIIDVLVNTKGKVIITGMGKSGIIGKKIAATMSSTGTSTIFVHPGEAFHGDLGMFENKDTVIAISNSGNTKELTDIMPILKEKIGTKIIGICSNKNSQLAQKSDHSLIYSLKNEGYLNLAPMASTVTQEIIGNLIATALMEKKKFKAEDFAIFHPGGSLGKQLLLTIKNIIKDGDLMDKFIICSETSIYDTILKLSNGGRGKGGVCVADSNDALLGVFTDGDLKRALKDHSSGDLKNIKVGELMTKTPKFTYIDEKPVNVLNLMETYNITFLPVLSRAEKLVGVLNIHDLLKEGIK